MQTYGNWTWEKLRARMNRSINSLPLPWKRMDRSIHLMVNASYLLLVAPAVLKFGFAMPMERTCVNLQTLAAHSQGLPAGHQMAGRWSSIPGLVVMLPFTSSMLMAVLRAA